MEAGKGVERGMGTSVTVSTVNFLKEKGGGAVCICGLRFLSSDSLLSPLHSGLAPTPQQGPSMTCPPRNLVLGLSSQLPGLQQHLTHLTPPRP